MALSTDQHGSVYSPITKSGVQTFSDMAKKSKFQSGQVKITGSLSPEVIFRSALSIARCRDDVSLESVLSHPVGPIPSAIFHEDGAMRKSTKAQLGLKLEETVPKVSMLPQHPQATSVYIRDGMNVIQTLPGENFSSFENLAKAYQEHLLTGFSKANTVVDVFDRYDNDNSVKAGERERRSKTGSGGREYSVIAGRSIPPRKKFLNVAANKQSLVSFLCNYIVQNAVQHMSPHPDWKLFLAGGFNSAEETKCISSRVGSFFRGAVYSRFLPWFLPSGRNYFFQFLPEESGRNQPFLEILYYFTKYLLINYL